MCYEMMVVLWFWFFMCLMDCCIFQNKIVEDIFFEIFVELGFYDFEFNLKLEQVWFEYVVMYWEFYFNFCVCLMEQEGMFWMYCYEKDWYVFVIGDINDLFKLLMFVDMILYYGVSVVSECNGIDWWDEVFNFCVGKIIYWDFNYDILLFLLMYVEVLIMFKNLNIGVIECYEYYLLYDYSDDGCWYVCYVMEVEEVQVYWFKGVGFVQVMIMVGCFWLINYFVLVYDDKVFVLLYVCYYVVNDYMSQGVEQLYCNSFMCLFVEVLFCFECCIFKFYMYGMQVVVVVGFKGEEIYIDGSCVKVYFFWDWCGKMDGFDFIWVCVLQLWVGVGWGGVVILCIG